MLVKIVRNALGYVFVLLDLLTRGFPRKRSLAEQNAIAEQTAHLTLYHFRACPFCIKVRRAMFKMSLPVAKKSVAEGSPYRAELEQGGGRVKVPCLRIDNPDGSTQWMYESNDIIAYLRQHYSSLT
mgnify:CR=1 FL=1|jgi:glutaredoxin